MISKQSLPINFAQGLDTKTDPWQVQPGNFLRLENQVFTKGGRLTKRNGYKQISTIINSGTHLPDTSVSSITTLNDNLTAIGNRIFAYTDASSTWFESNNPYQSLELSTLPIIRNSFNQVQCDSAVAPNGLVCTVYTEEASATTTVFRVTVTDSVTGQSVYNFGVPIANAAATQTQRVFVVGNFFVVVFTSGSAALSYFALGVNDPNNISGPITDIAASYQPSDGVSWDAVVVNDRLYIAYPTSSGGQAVKLTYLTAGDAIAGNSPVSPVTFAGYEATLMSMCADTRVPTAPIIYANFYDDGSTDAFSVAVDGDLNVAMIPTRLFTGVDVANLASAVPGGEAGASGDCYIFYEVNNNYGYDNSIPTHYINTVAVRHSGLPVTFESEFLSGAGTITASSATGLVNGMHLIDATTKSNLDQPTTFTISGVTLSLSANTNGNSAATPGDTMMAQTTSLSVSNTQIARSVGLASKAFVVGDDIYFWVAYQSPYQNTYFLINANVNVGFNATVIIAKLAYENGGGYLTTGLPLVSIVGEDCYVPYLFKDLITPVNKGTDVPSGTQVAGVYSQFGINLCKFKIGTTKLQTAEIGKDLLITGGFGWMYDGSQPSEQGFFLYPDDVQAEPLADPGPTGNLDDTSDPTILKNVSSTTGIVVGMIVTDVTNPSAIPAGTRVVSIDSMAGEVTMSNPAASTHTGDTLKFAGEVAAQQYFYQVIYQWTDNQGNLYQSAPSIPVTATTTSGHTSVVLDIPKLRLSMKFLSSIKIVIYRWSVAQPIYYQVTSITSPLMNTSGSDPDYVTYTDILSDAEILGNSIIYTNGGVLENVNAPAHRICTLFDNRYWAVSAENPNLLLFSKQVIEAVPVEMCSQLTLFVAPTTGAEGSTGDMTAIAPMDDKLIIFKPNAIYYINGSGPDNTGANNQYSQPIFVNSTVGCDNPDSIVFQPNGLMFQSGKGMWLLGRDLSTTYIGAAVEQFNSSIVQSAVSVPETNQVRFTLNTGEMLMYDYFYGQWSTFKGAPAISSCIFEGLHTFLNSYSQVFQEAPGSYVDGSTPVLLGLTTSWFNLAGLQGYQRAYFFYLLGQYITAHKLFVTVAYDYNSAPQQGSLIMPTNFASVYGGPVPNPDNGYDPQDPLGQQSPLGGEGNVEQWRIFLNKQRCQAVQISIQEIFDASMGVQPGEGLTLSGINLIYGVKQAFKPMAARNSIGGGQ